MIRFVRGRLAAREDDAAVVDVGGVGMLLRVSATTLRALPAAGADVMLHAHLVVREDALDLYGFASAAERALFEAFTGVSGVGPRLALALCGLDEPDALRVAVARGDAARLQKASGVGKRTAERVVLELRDRVGAVNGAARAAGPIPAGDAAASAQEGLLGLGFRPEEVDQALAGAPEGLSPEDLLRHALARLRRG
ncbi:MAG: Holliday junction branch migration protein RuvA [Thermoleophilia bacterium]|nr:Holliday junction branch migration protein RuvA [Thermoleophilia bacterium]